MTTFSVATKESWKNDKGEWQSRTDWHRVVTFDKLAEYTRTLPKGTHVMVQGSLRSREYESDGVQRSPASTRATVSSAEFLNCARTGLQNLIERSAGKKIQRPPISDNSGESLSNAEALPSSNLEGFPLRQILLKRLDKNATNFPQTDFWDYRSGFRF